MPYDATRQHFSVFGHRKRFGICHKFDCFACVIEIVLFPQIPLGKCGRVKFYIGQIDIYIRIDRLQCVDFFITARIIDDGDFGKELQSLCLDVKVLDENDDEIDLKQDFDDDGTEFVPADAGEIVNDVEGADGFEIEEVPEDEEGDFGLFDDDDFGAPVLDADEDLGSFADDFGQFLGGNESADY